MRQLHGILSVAGQHRKALQAVQRSAIRFACSDYPSGYFHAAVAWLAWDTLEVHRHLNAATVMHKNSPQSNTLVKLAYGGTRSNHDHTNVDTSLPMVTPTSSLFSLVQSCLSTSLPMSAIKVESTAVFQRNAIPTIMQYCAVV